MTSRLGLIGAALAAAWLTGCGGSSPAALPQATTKDSKPAAEGARHSISPMGKGIKQRDLLYVSNGNGTVNVYRYWQRTLAGVITNVLEPEGMCSDAKGNVFIAERRELHTGPWKHVIYEYAHGGTKPINVLGDPQAPWACSVDPATGNLAVANYRKESVSIYAHAQGEPVVYKPDDNEHFISCAYDDRGDLLIASAPGYYDYNSYFYYMPKGGNQLILMDLPGGYRYYGQWIDVDGVAWDGKYWVAIADDTLYRYTINVDAQFVNQTTLSPSAGAVGPVAIYRKSPKADGTQLVSALGRVEYWKYPDGVYPFANITKDLDDPYGVTISMGQ
jgi:hypothetical protein